MEKTFDDRINNRLGDASTVNTLMYILWGIFFFAVKSKWFYLVFGVLNITLINLVVIVCIFYKAYAKRDLLSNYKRVRNTVIRDIIYSAMLLFLIIAAIIRFPQ